MGSSEQLSAQAIGDEVQSWVDAARAVLSARVQVIVAGNKATDALRQHLLQARRGDGVLWHFLPLRPGELELLRAVSRKAVLPRVSPDDQRELDRLTTEVAAATDDLRKVTGFGRLLLFGGTRDKANQAAQFLTDYRRWLLTSGLGRAIEQAAPVENKQIQDLTASDALAGWVGLDRLLPGQGQAASIEESRSFATLPNAIAVIRRAASEEAKKRKLAVDAGNNVRNKETDRMLAGMPADRLREATRDKIRVGALTDNGITNVLGVLANEHRLETFDGIGETSATCIRGAARTLRQNTFDEMPMRIDVKNRTAEYTEFLECLRAWDAARRASASSADMAVVDELAPVAAAIDKTVTHAVVDPVAPSTVEDFRDSVQAVARLARGVADAQVAAVGGDPWDDFLSRPADYLALLAELGFITEDDEKTHGDLPTEIVEAVREFELNGDYLTASLRGYQSFAARFALVQRKVIIGDEMGLGKTVEAIAVLAHLRAKGNHHSLVVCPAAVVTNWVREVAAKSKLSSHRLHGPDRQWAAKTWARNGGVAVTTFETLPWLKNHVSLPELSCVVVDEAHYIKNTDALRTQRTTQLIDSCERAVLLTGTPLENRLDEFRNLVGYLRSDLVVDANEFSPKKFRRQVAPAYLRRNQEDVLTELPELVEVEEWLAMSGADLRSYTAAVEQRNFMAMRQAAMNQGRKSAKMERLVEIVEEAEANGRRVVVFSHFLDVLRQVADQLPGRVFGPLTGSVAATRRQEMVDQFSSAKHGAVLVAQILAGGVGLNIQAASVVVICEPQLKPTVEWQAIARAHRMGQLESVQVHRLLSDEGVDQRVREILARKKELFESFARQSETAESAPEAYDITEAELAREIIAAERERLFGHKPPTTSADHPVAKENSEAPTDRPLPSRPDTAAVKPKLGTPTGDELNGSSAEAADSVLRTPSDQDIKLLQRMTALTREKDVARGASSQSSSVSRPVLKPYPVFREVLSAIGQTPSDEVAKTIVRIVAVEGPMTGWRIHEVYKKCSGSRESHDVFSRLVNRAISSAERNRMIVSDNPLNQTGNKPRTFRLSSQPRALARELGPRTIDIVPPAEIAQYWLDVPGDASIAEDEALQQVVKGLGIKQVTPHVRNVLLGAAGLVRPNSGSGGAGASTGSSIP